MNKLLLSQAKRCSVEAPGSPLLSYWRQKEINSRVSFAHRWWNWGLRWGSCIGRNGSRWSHACATKGEASRLLVMKFLITEIKRCVPHMLSSTLVISLQHSFQRCQTIISSYNRIAPSPISLHLLWFQDSTTHFPVSNRLGKMFNSPCLSIHATQKPGFQLQHVQYIKKRFSVVVSRQAPVPNGFLRRSGFQPKHLE